MSLFGLKSFGQVTHHSILDGFSSSIWKIDATPGGQQFAIGNSGNVFRRVTGCNSWEKIALPSTVTQGLRDISFPTNQVGYISGTSGRLIKTIDGGATWNTLTTNTTAALVSTYFVNDTTGFISGGGSSGKIIYKTIDGGSNWTDVTPSGLTSTPYELLFADADTGYALCTNGQILKSTDAGDTWNTIHPASSGISSLYAGDLINDSTIVGAGSSGTIVKSTDYGATWQQLTSGTTSFLWGIRFYDDQVGAALGSSGKLLITQDGGTTWTQYTTPITTTLRDIYWENDHAGIIVGSSARVFKFDLNQTHDVLLEEHFCAPEDSTTYFGWTNTGVANAQELWRFDNPNTNGVSYVMNSPFAVFDGQYYQNTVGFIDPDSSFLESPEFDATGYDTLSLSWHEAYLCNYLGEVYTAVDVYNGTSWVNVYTSNGVEINGSFSAVYSTPTTGNLAPRSIDITELAGVSNAKIRFKYYSTNNTTLKFWWAIDDIIVTNKKTDVALQNVSVSPGMNGSCTMTASEDLILNIKNVGDMDVFPVEVSYQINNQPEVRKAVYDALYIGEDTTVIIDAIDLSNPDVYNIKVWLRKVNDSNTSNDTISITLNSTAGLGLSLGNDTSICEGEVVQLSSNVASPDSILWNDSIYSPTLSIDSAGIFKIAVSKQGCIEYDTIEISLSGSPDQAMITSMDSIICGNDSIILHTSSDSTIWSTGAINDSIVVSNQQVYWALGVDNGCQSMDTTFVNVTTSNLPVVPSIQSSITGTTFCEGDSVELSITTNDDILWSNGSTNTSIQINQTTDVFAQVYDGICWSVNSDTVSLEMLDSPDQPIVTTNGFELSTATIADNYQWYINGNLINGATNNTYTATTDGYYQVEAISSNLCTSISDSVELIGTSINENTLSDIKVYPNPSQGTFNVLHTSQIDKLIITNLTGQILQQVSVNNRSIQLSPNLSPGIYLLNIYSDQLQLTYQLVIQ